MTTLDEIDSIIENINQSNIIGYGTFADYEELFNLIKSISQLRVELDLGNLKAVSDRANDMKVLLESFNLKIKTTFNLISVDELEKIRDFFRSILIMLDTIERFVFTVQNQPVIRNSQMTVNMTNIMSRVYKDLDCIFSDHNNNECFIIPSSLLINEYQVIQNQINRFCEYSSFISNLEEKIDNQYDENQSSC